MKNLNIFLLFWVVVGVTLNCENSLAHTDAIQRIETPSIVSKNIANNNSSGDESYVEYSNYNEDMLPLLSRDLNLLMQAIDMIEDNACREQCKFIINHLNNLTNWAVKFYDASGKFPEGVLGGSTFQLGNFDECLSIGRGNDDAPLGVSGQYCLADIGITVPEVYLQKTDSIWRNFRDTKERYEESIKTLHWGICVPTLCGPQDVQDVITRVLGVAFSGSRLTLTPTIPEGSCYKDKSFAAATTVDIIYLCVILSVTLLVVIGTIFHFFCMKSNSNISKGALPQVLLAFSLVSNFNKICGPAHDDGLHLECISGIKFVSMVLIVAGHTLIFVVSGPILNKEFWEHAISKVENSVFLNNPLLVDTFLLLSGFLFSRILLKELDKRKSVNFLLLYVFRYIRLTPAYIVIVGLYATWLPKLDSGPLSSRLVIEKERCQASWWTNILYINNYVNVNNLCMFQSWYLSVDTQLFILAPLIIYPLWKWRRFGECLLAAVTTLSMLIPFAVTLTERLDPTLMIYTAEVKDISTNNYFASTYIKTHMRASAYCFGLIYGYIIYRIQTEDYRLSKNVVKLGWLVGTLSLIASMCSISIFYGPRKNFTAIEAAVYSSLHRALWSIGTGWVLVACITDNSGPIRNFLKWRVFIPLSRLTYCAYLVNGLVELHSVSTIRSPRYLDTFSLFSLVLSHLMLTFVGATLLSTMFESPILGIERIFLRKDKKPSGEAKETDEATSTESL